MNTSIKLKRKQFIKRKLSVKKRVRGNAERPRVSVYRSHKHIYAQIIDDESMKTLASVSDKNLKSTKGNPVELAAMVGEELGKLAKAKKIDKVVFDRSGYLYHGRVKALADGLRKAGLNL
ncbi:50S ribosomal protein L18 [Candidatus Dojkabacteria bacterium]|uniref:Large ribosomal subunit protein uL18 n=1 Tax=Candidatus Dojkabacteria bacterium TaxID=2099670 RepID=A0A955LBE5_9BACT|nr:50S ribosomal protein L18 [Candidatus Dojkabacteria bacterium]